jgi:diadenosine tetraphosphate (Ap4A) HIT family hydrolase
MDIPCEVCTILPEIKPEYTIIDSPFWIANLRDTDQTLVGTTFITAKRHVPELDELTPDEDLDFIVVRNSLFRAIKTSFDPITFNTSCLKNDAFRDKPDHTLTEAGHVHWHIKPTYTSLAQTINGEMFVDPAPGRYLELSSFKRHQPTEETARQIASLIRRNLPEYPTPV